MAHMRVHQSFLIGGPEQAGEGKDFVGGAGACECVKASAMFMATQVRVGP